jgi:hypothetical protein
MATNTTSGDSKTLQTHPCYKNKASYYIEMLPFIVFAIVTGYYIGFI